MSDNDKVTTGSRKEPPSPTEDPPPAKKATVDDTAGLAESASSNTVAAEGKKTKVAADNEDSDGDKKMPATEKQKYEQGTQTNTLEASHSDIVTVHLIRESKGTETEKSQRVRYYSMIKKLRQHKQFKGVVNINPYQTYYACPQVNRNQLLTSIGFCQLVEALENGLPGHKPPINANTQIYIVTVNLLRFGKTEQLIKAAVKLLLDAASRGNLDLKIMPMNFFGLELSDDVIALQSDFFTKQGDIYRGIASNQDQGNNIAPDPNTANERKFVKKKKNELKSNFDSLENITYIALNLVEIKEGKPDYKEELVRNVSGQIVRINIWVAFDYDEFCNKCLAVFKEVVNCDKVGSKRREFLKSKVSELKFYVHPYKGEVKFTGAYGRTSPKSSSMVMNGVPVDQMCANYACISYHHGKPIKDVAHAIFFDAGVKRSKWIKQEYVNLLAFKLAGACFDVYAVLPVRYSNNSALVEFDDVVNEVMGITGHFTKGIGKTRENLCKMENNKRKAMAEISKEFQSARKKLRDNQLPVTGKVGVITGEVSEIVDIIGSGKPGKKVAKEYGLSIDANNAEDADDDCNSVDSECEWSVSSCESEDDDEDEMQKL